MDGIIPCEEKEIITCNLLGKKSIFKPESMNMNDEQLVKKCLEKDAFAQKLLFDTYSRKLMGLCMRYARDEDEAQDVLQMGFIKVFEKLDMYNGNGSLEGWIRRILVNTALDNIRRNKNMKDSVDIDKVDYQLNSHSENAIDALSAQDLLKVINSLPTGFKTVFNLYAIEGYSHKEIAEMLDISVNTSKSQYSRARAHLKNLIINEKIIE